MFDFFKRNKELNIFQKFANETNGKYLEPKYDEDAKTEVAYGELKILFDYYTNYITVGGQNHEKTYTRVIFAYKAVDNFRFEIYDNGFIRSIEKIFGAEDIEIGKPDFDKKFIVKSTSPIKIRTFLQNEKIRNSIESLKEVNILVSDCKGIWGKKLPEKEFELTYFSSNRIKSTEELKTLLNLFKEMINGFIELKLIDERASS